MSADTPQVPTKKKQKYSISQLRVVFDTNALYVMPNSLGCTSDLVRQEIADLIAEAKHPDLDLVWYLPEIVRNERQYQMQVEVLKLRFAILKIERLLGHNLALTDQVLLEHVATKINETERHLGLQEIKLDTNRVDWTVLINSASYRLPPFRSGETEKGFRDAIVAETFLQLVNDSPKTPKYCRIVLVTGDELLSAAVRARISSLPNVSVVPNIQELRGLINALVSNVDEEYIAMVKPRASRMFFITNAEKDTLYFTETIKDKLTENFAAELASYPQGTTFRSNGQWIINDPNFAKKEGNRIFWTSRIEILVEAGNYMTTDQGQISYPLSPSGSYLGSPVQTIKGITPTMIGPFPTSYFKTPEMPIGLQITPNIFESAPYKLSASLVTSSSKRVPTHKGKDVYEISWSTAVTQKGVLKKPIIEDIRHVEVNWEAI
jgi:hypothetical protein